jgi:hypothetical protein
MRAGKHSASRPVFVRANPVYTATDYGLAEFCMNKCLLMVVAVLSIQACSQPVRTLTAKNASRLQSESTVTRDCDDCLFYEDMDFDPVMVEAQWNESKATGFTFNAPRGGQACRFFYRPVLSREAGMSPVVPADIETSPQPSPARFHAYFVRLTATGSHNPIDRWGSRSQLVEIRMRVISARASLKARRQLGCDRTT